VRLAVVDNGPGFAEHVLKRAFEPYVTTKPRGTGLGLAVVKKIADEHQARIRVMNLHAGRRRGSGQRGQSFVIICLRMTSIPHSMFTEFPCPPSL